jgi:peptidyl-prolyl cis-trans isomerase D
MGRPNGETNMLQSIREKTSGWIATVILGLIILTFGFFGIESYLQSEVVNYTARIEGPAKYFGLFGKQKRDISQDEFRNRLQQVRDQRKAAQGDAFDAAEFEKIDNKRAVLDQLIDQAIGQMAAERDGLNVSNASVQKLIAGIPDFQKNGKFDPDMYSLGLQMRQTTARDFEALVRTSLIQGLLPTQIASSGYLSDKELDRYIKLTEQTRDLQVVEIPPPVPADAVPPSAAEIAAWYDAHKSSYRSPETVTAEYIELDGSTLPVPTTVSDADLLERYKNEKARFGTEEQKLASHILVAVDEKAPAATVAAALAKAKDIAAKAHAPGADFAALARQYSDDAGSKGAGGDLGPVGKGVFGDAFDTAFAALGKGQVSEPVRLAEGWDIIQFRDVVPGSLKPFEEVRAQLLNEALEGDRERAFSDVSGKLVDSVLADPTQLAATAKKFNLVLNRTSPFTRGGGDGIAALAPVRKAAFSAAQLTERQASDAIEIAPNHIVVLRVLDHKPETVMPLAQVRDRVIADVAQDKLAKQAKTRAEALLARARKGESLDFIAAEIGGKVMPVPGAPRTPPNPALAPVFVEAFRQLPPVNGKGEIGLVKLTGDHYVLVTVTAVTEGDVSKMDAATRKTARENIARVRADVEAKAMTANLRKGYKIDVAEDRL